MSESEWSMGELFNTMLTEARIAATQGWYAGLTGYLVPRCNYTEQELREELLLRNEQEGDKVAIFEQFVLDALNGEL